MGRLKLDIMPSDEEMKKPRKHSFVNLHYKKEYSAKHLAITYLKVGLTRDMELANSEILLTRNGLNKDKVNEAMLREAKEIIFRIIKQFLKELEN